MNAPLTADNDTFAPLSLSHVPVTTRTLKGADAGQSGGNHAEMPMTAPLQLGCFPHPPANGGAAAPTGAVSVAVGAAAAVAAGAAVESVAMGAVTTSRTRPPQCTTSDEFEVGNKSAALSLPPSLTPPLSLCLCFSRTLSHSLWLSIFG